jgi:r-opsin
MEQVIAFSITTGKYLLTLVVSRYVPEGNMTACGTDYLNKDWFSRSYILVYSIFCYFIPLFSIIYAYYFIVGAVAAHEKNMKEQAKKMNVASLRSGDDKAQSAECKLAKVCEFQYG